MSILRPLFFTEAIMEIKNFFTRQPSDIAREVLRRQRPIFPQQIEVPLEFLSERAKAHKGLVALGGIPETPIRRFARGPRGQYHRSVVTYIKIFGR